MVWGVIVITLATGILFCSYFTETWAQDARDAAESLGPEFGPEPRRHGPGAARLRELPPPSLSVPAERTMDREAEVPSQAYRTLRAQQRRLRGVTRWLRVCAVGYLLVGLAAVWLCTTVIR